MDPASIWALVESSASLAVKCFSVAKTLNDIAAKYKQSKLMISSAVQDLETIQFAWTRIGKWSQIYAEKNGFESQNGIAADHELFQRIEKSLAVGNMVMEALDEDLLPYKNVTENISFKVRAKMV
ncbi:hypothetical protein P7C71_g3985, partial [Lecanoromycetidae sp. Uapishka_2]